jgi:hypothetical protein
MAKKRRPKASSRRRSGISRSYGVTRPSETPPEPSGENADPKRPRSAPAPGLPMSAREYDRLKEQARSGPAPSGAPAQEDRRKSR